jgi:hypothetical protein
MTRDYYKPAIFLTWLALPLTALNYWRAWDHLPARMAVHFDANWQPNGFTSREGSLIFALAVTTFMLVVFTIAALVVRAQKPSSAWPVLVVFYVALGLVWLANNYIVNLNLNSQPARSELVGPTSPAMRDSGETDFLSRHS